MLDVRQRCWMFVRGHCFFDLDAVEGGFLVGELQGGGKYSDRNFILQSGSFVAPAHGAVFSPSHFTTHDPSSGNPGACRAGAPSHPAAIIATA